MKACGVCGSDLSYIKIGGIHRKPGGVTPIGHEAAGEVIAVGNAVKGVSVGQRVVINPMQTPSYIGSGGPEGAFTEELLVRDARVGDSLLPIPDDLPFEIAAMTEPLAVALHGVNRMQVKPATRPSYSAAVRSGSAWCCGWSIAASPMSSHSICRRSGSNARRRWAHARCINPAKEDVRARLKELHGSARMFSRECVGTDAYIDAAGAPSIVSDVIGMAKYHSRLVITAAYMKPVEVNLGAMLTTEMTITTAVGYPDEMPEVIAALPRLRDKVQRLDQPSLPVRQDHRCARRRRHAAIREGHGRLRGRRRMSDARRTTSRCWRAWSAPAISRRKPSGSPISFSWRRTFPTPTW